MYSVSFHRWVFTWHSTANERTHAGSRVCSRTPRENKILLQVSNLWDLWGRLWTAGQNNWKYFLLGCLINLYVLLFIKRHQSRRGGESGGNPSCLGVGPSVGNSLGGWNSPAAYTYIRWSKVIGNTGERLMFRMTGENKSNTESGVPIHSSFSGTPPPRPGSLFTTSHSTCGVHWCEFDAELQPL